MKMKVEYQMQIHHVFTQEEIARTEGLKEHLASGGTFDEYLNQRLKADQKITLHNGQPLQAFIQNNNWTDEEKPC